MKRCPSQNPLPAVLVTILLLGFLATIGLISHLPISDEGEESPTRIYFTKAEPRYSIPQPSRLQAPPPQMDLHTEVYTTPELTNLDELCVDELPLLLPIELISSPEIDAAPPPPPPTSPSPFRQKSPAIATHSDKPHYIPPVCLLAPQPDYPPALRSSRRSGSVRIRIEISSDGTPTAVTIISSTHPDFAATVRRCILKQWKFRPAKTNGTPTASAATQTIYFRP